MENAFINTFLVKIFEKKKNISNLMWKFEKTETKQNTNDKII